MTKEYLEHLIWSQNPHALSQQPLVDRQLWCGAVQHELVKYRITVAAGLPAMPADAVHDVAVIMMVKDEADVLEDNLRWLYFLGIRRFAVSDNLSTDRSRDILPDFQHDHPDVELVIVSDPLVRFMQPEKINGLFRLVLSIWPDLKWVIPVDADEFMIAQSGLRSLQQVPDHVDALTVPKMVHFRHHLQPYRDDEVLLRMACRSPLFCVPPKIILRARMNLQITRGSHQVRTSGETEPRYDGGFTYGLYIREFPVRSLEQFIRKVHNGAAAILAAQRHGDRKVGGDHWLRYFARLTSGGESGLRDIFLDEWVKTSLPPGWRLDPFAGAPRRDAA